MKCVDCGYGLADGRSLHRQNEKGVPGIWKCEQCNKLEVHEDVANVVASVELMNKPVVH